MNKEELLGVLDFLRGAEQLKNTIRRCYTSEGRSEGRNPEDFDYRFNLQYGRRYTADDPVIAALRDILDQETARRAREAEAARP